MYLIDMLLLLLIYYYQTVNGFSDRHFRLDRSDIHGTRVVVLYLRVPYFMFCSGQSGNAGGAGVP